MAGINNHIIQRQFLEVDMESGIDAFQFRNDLKDVFNEKLLPELEAVFDELSKGNKLVRLENIQIDIGDLSSKNWEEELVMKSVEKIKEALILEYEEFAPAHFNEALYNFLKYGRLPWFIQTQSDLEEELRAWLKNDVAFKDSFMDYLSSAPSGELVRLIYQFDDEVIERIIDLIMPQQYKAFSKNVFENKQVLASAFYSFSIDKINARRIIYLPFLNWFRHNDIADVYVFYVQRLLELLQLEINLELDVFTKELLVSFKGNDLSDNNRLCELINQMKKTSSLRPNDKEEEDNKRGEVGRGEEMFIRNAGLVLLHPFLIPLFMEVNLLDENNKFLNEKARMRGVLLSQHLVTGETLFEEHELVINKILFGLPIEEPIQKELILTEKEAQETMILLEQVIQLWKMNNVAVNSSINGLRSSFLQREGKITLKNDQWKLQVEQKPYDMVLSSLPWGIGVIKYSYMSQMLWVEWS
jgi:hypothetical protein